MHDGRLATEVRADPCLRRARVRHVAVDALRGDPIPLAPAAEQHPQRCARDRIALRERGIAGGPHVAEWVVAVGDVCGLLVVDDGVRPRTRARHDQVESRQVERLDRRGVERQQRPEGPLARAQLLQERRADLAMREAPLGPVLVVDGRVDRGIRIDLAQGEEDPLRSPQIEQEVVYQRHPAWLSHARSLTTELAEASATNDAMPRRAIPTIAVAVSLALAPATAFADGAGDEQYQDPLAAPTTPSKTTKKQATTTTPATSTPAATTVPASTTTTAVASPQSTATSKELP